MSWPAPKRDYLPGRIGVSYSRSAFLTFLAFPAFLESPRSLTSCEDAIRLSGMNAINLRATYMKTVETIMWKVPYITNILFLFSAPLAALYLTLRWW